MAPSDRRSAHRSRRCIPLLMILVAFGATIAIHLIAILAVLLIAVALEIKDVQGGSKFDWTDIAVTIIGAILIPICCFLYL